MAGADLRETQRFEARQQAVPPRAGASCGLPVMVLAGCLAMGAVPAVFAEGAWRPADLGSLLNEETLEGALPGKAGAAGFGRVRPPLAFERNEGQTDGVVSFLARGRGYTLFLTGPEAVLRLRDADVAVGGGPVERERDVKPPRVLRMRLLGANPQPVMEGEQLLRGKVNYFIGNEPSLWRTNIATFGKVRYREVYPGIDLVYYGNEGQLEYDFVVAPGADPNRIAMAFEGAEEMRVDEGGDLLLKVGDREVRWQKPFIFQQVNGVRQEVVGTYRLLEGPRGDGLLTPAAGPLPEVSFELAAYDRALPLVIDPRLVYSTYLGGSGSDRAQAVASDGQGNLWVAGGTASIDFPTKNALASQNAGGDLDVFMTKLSPSGEMLFSTYLGGSGNDNWTQGLDMSVSATGDVYLVGTTGSWDFPLSDPVQDWFGGGEYDVFLTGLKADGSALLFSTYLGGEERDVGWAVALGPAGDIYVGGFTRSAGFPSKNGFQPNISASYNGEQLQEGFITRLESGGRSIVYSTFYGLSSRWERVSDLTVDSLGNAYVAVAVSPWEGAPFWLVSKIHSDGGSRLFERRWPASGTQAEVVSPRLALGQNDMLVVAGSVYAFSAFSLPAVNKPNASTTQGYSDTYIALFNTTNGAPISAVYLGGGGSDSPSSVLVGKGGDIIVVGSTSGGNFQSSGFPVSDPMESGPEPGKSVDVYVAKFRSADLSLVFSTLIGGPLGDFSGGVFNGGGVAPDANGNLCIAGYTEGQFPTANALQPIDAGETDAFVVKLSFGEKIQISRSGQTLRLSWPVSASGFVLESATSPAAAAGEWTLVPQVPVPEGDQNVVTLEIGPGSQFFRLRGS